MGQRVTRWCARSVAGALWIGLHLAAQAATPAAVTGAVTKVRGAHLEGWACDAGAPTSTLQVRVFDGNGQVVASATANEHESGLARHEPACGNDRHGFTIDLPKAVFSCAAQSLTVAAAPAAGGAPVALSGSGSIAGVASRPPAGQITVSAQGSAANARLRATFTPEANGGSLIRVRWLDGATVIGETTKAPHTVQWTPRRTGGHSIHAITTDSCGVSNHATVSFDSGSGNAAASPPLVSFADPGPRRSYFTIGNLPLRVNITRQTSPLAQFRLYYATSADDPAAPYQPLTAVSAPDAGNYIGSWALPRPAAGTGWDGRYVLLAEAEDAAGRIGTARLELPLALPTYGDSASTTYGVGKLANNNVLLTALFTIGRPGEDAAAEFAGDDVIEDGALVHARTDGAVPLKVLNTVTVTVVGGGTVSATVLAGTTTTARFANCVANCTATFDTNAPGGADLTITAAPNPGNVFAGWLGVPCTGTGSCRFTVSASASVTATFAPATMAPGGILPVTFDADANLTQDALTDGLLIVRYMLNIAEASIVGGALGTGAQRGSPGQPTISGYLSAIRPVLDVDGNGLVQAIARLSIP